MGWAVSVRRWDAHVLMGVAWVNIGHELARGHEVAG